MLSPARLSSHSLPQCGTPLPCSGVSVQPWMADVHLQHHAGKRRHCWPEGNLSRLCQQTTSRPSRTCARRPASSSQQVQAHLCSLLWDAAGEATMTSVMPGTGSGQGRCVGAEVSPSTQSHASGSWMCSSGTYWPAQMALTCQPRVWKRFGTILPECLV